MKTLILSVGLSLGLALSSSIVWAAGPESAPYDPETRQTMQTWSVDEHIASAKAAKEKFDVIEAKVEALQQRIDRFAQKPYLDTKGFKRQGLRLLKGKLMNELGQAADRVVWHENLAKEILVSQDKSQQHS